MVKKLIQKNLVEDVEIEQEQEEEQPEPIKQEEHIKKKKVLSQKQLENLKKGRELGQQKLREKGAITREKVQQVKEIKKIQEEEKINDIDDLKRVNDLSYIRRTVENLHSKINVLENVNNKFDTFLKQKEERHKVKNSNAIQETVKQELPKAVNNLYLQQKIQKEMSLNPFMGRV